MIYVGGISFYSHEHGWACDTVISFEVVLANSSIVIVSETQHALLFWALRGGGNNLGIVTSITLETFHKPPAHYTFQRWHICMLEPVLQRLQQLTESLPKGIDMVATTLGLDVSRDELAVTERLIASKMPVLPQKLPLKAKAVCNSSPDTRVLGERVYVDTTLALAQKMDRMNPAGYFNLFGSVTVKNEVQILWDLAEGFTREIEAVKGAAGLHVYIVYNPVTVSTIRKMQARGGNALGMKPLDGPLVGSYRLSVSKPFTADVFSCEHKFTLES